MNGSGYGLFDRSIHVKQDSRKPLPTACRKQIGSDCAMSRDREPLAISTMSWEPMSSGKAMRLHGDATGASDVFVE